MAATTVIPLTTLEDHRAVRFVVEFVDRLGEECGFDPAGLINPRTKEPFGPFIERLRSALRSYEAAHESREPQASGPSHAP
jgi:hypothetical protein